MPVNVESTSETLTRLAELNAVILNRDPIERPVYAGVVDGAIKLSTSINWYVDAGCAMRNTTVGLTGGEPRKVAGMGQLLRLFAVRTGCKVMMQNVIDDIGHRLASRNQ